MKKVQSLLMTLLLLCGWCLTPITIVATEIDLIESYNLDVQLEDEIEHDTFSLEQETESFNFDSEDTIHLTLDTDSNLATYPSDEYTIGENGELEPVSENNMDSMIVDTRELVNDTTESPYSSTAKILAIRDYTLNGENKNYAIGCSASIIETNSLITAAHCLYTETPLYNANKYPDRIIIYPGKNGNSNPYGEYIAREMYIPTDFVLNGNTGVNDYAVIKTELTMAVDTLKLSSNISDTAFTSGYPGEKSNYMYKGNGETDYGYLNYYNRLLLKNIVVTRGQSGSPIYNENQEVFGIMTHSNVADPGKIDGIDDGVITYGFGVALRDTTLKQVSQWIYGKNIVKDGNYIYTLDNEQNIQHTQEYSNNIRIKVYYFYGNTKYDGNQWDHVKYEFRLHEDATIGWAKLYEDNTKINTMIYNFYSGTKFDSDRWKNVQFDLRMNSDKTISWARRKEKGTGVITHIYHFYTGTGYTTDRWNHVKYEFRLNADNTIGWAKLYEDNTKINTAIYTFYPNTVYDTNRWNHVQFAYKMDKNGNIISAQRKRDVTQEVVKTYIFKANTKYDSNRWNYVEREY